jgi:hypothetical protein
MSKFKPVFFSILGTIVSAAAIAFFGLKKRTAKEVLSKKDAGKIPPKAGDSDEGLYKTIGLKKVELKHIPKDLPVRLFEEIFTGEVRIDPDDHDKYKISVHDNQGRAIGPIGKNRRLSNSITAWHQGKVFTFGRLTKNDESGSVSGFTFIPVGLSNEQTKNLKGVFEKLHKRKTVLAQPNITSSEYLSILNDHKFISTVLFQLDISDVIDVTLSKRIIPALSKQLEDEQDWQRIIKLDKHNDLIDELSERFAGATYRRITKAKKMKNL